MVGTVKAAAAVLLWALSGPALAGDFARCILEKMPGTQNLTAAQSVHRVCATEYPEEYFLELKGQGRGLFGYRDQYACIIDKTRNTALQPAALAIARACTCLYQVPAHKGEMCEPPP